MPVRKNKETELRFPDAFPKSFQRLAGESYQEFKKYLPEQVERYTTFICHSDMKPFWEDVEKNLLTEPPKNGSCFTAHSIFSCFFVAFYSINNIPNLSRKDFKNDFQDIQKLLERLSILCKSDKLISKRMNDSLHVSLLEKDRDQYVGSYLDFSEILNSMDKNLKDSAESNFLYREYLQLPRELTPLKKLTKQKTHFIHHFSKMTTIVYGRKDHSKTVNVLGCVLPDLEVEKTDVTQFFKNKKRKTGAVTS